MLCEEVTLALILRITATGKANISKSSKKKQFSTSLYFVSLQKIFSFTLEKLPNNNKYPSKLSSGPKPEVLSW